MKRIIIAVVVGILGILSLAPMAFGANNDRVISERDIEKNLQEMRALEASLDIGESVELLPTTDSYIELDNFTISRDKENAILWSWSGHGDVDDSPISYWIEVDPVTMEYRTVQDLTREQELMSEREEENSTEAVNRIRNIEIATKDAIRILTCQTNLTLKWTTDNNAITTSSATKSSISKSPTSKMSFAPFNNNILPTNWYLDSNTLTKSWNSTQAQAKTVGKHYNYDFWDPDKGTFVTHNLWLYGFNDGGWSNDFSVSNTGEFYFTLVPHVSAW